MSMIIFVKVGTIRWILFPLFRTGRRGWSSFGVQCSECYLSQRLTSLLFHVVSLVCYKIELIFISCQYHICILLTDTMESSILCRTRWGRFVDQIVSQGEGTRVVDGRQTWPARVLPKTHRDGHPYSGEVWTREWTHVSGPLCLVELRLWTGSASNTERWRENKFFRVTRIYWCYWGDFDFSSGLILVFTPFKNQELIQEITW